MAKAAAVKSAEALSAAPHGRTPDNTPIPGGGRWAWDDERGVWVSLDSKPEKTNETEGT